jgi:hypothetical protein
MVPFQDYFCNVWFNTELCPVVMNMLRCAICLRQAKWYNSRNAWYNSDRSILRK